jgi:hypothetical protein
VEDFLAEPSLRKRRIHHLFVVLIDTAKGRMTIKRPDGDMVFTQGK